METKGETQKDREAHCSVFNVVAKDIEPQNAYPGSRMNVAKRDRDAKNDFHARSVATMGMKPGIVTLSHTITLHNIPDQTNLNLRHRCIMRDVRLRFESCLE